jgi:hypothetical protein
MGKALGALAAVLVAVGLLAASEQLPLEPTRESGQGVTAAYEGWYRSSDGTIRLLVGYFNRNEKEVLEIPVGPDNRIEPGGPDRGQPTHFLPRRAWGVFTIALPADFGSQKLTWTLVAHGKMTQIPMALNPLWEVEPYKDAAQGNTPPVLRFAPDGPPHQGPPQGIQHTLEATAGEPLTLTAWASDDALVDPDRTEREGPPVTVSWSKFRGPGEVKFENAKPDVDFDNGGKATTAATFWLPGEYILRLQANDVSGEGGGGFQCCWTNAHVKVIVTGTVN